MLQGIKAWLDQQSLKLITDSKINIITVPRSECDLTNQSAVLDFIQSTKIDEVYLAAAESVALKQTQKINIDLYENLMIESNIINACIQRHKKITLLRLIMYLS